MDGNCKNNKLKKIVFSNNLLEIPSDFFEGPPIYGCVVYDTFTNLKEINIPNSVITIGSRAFSNCTELTSITIPDSVTSIGDYAFYNCTGLTSITIPNSVTIIGDYAFGNCTRLTKIDVQEANNNYSSTDGILYNKDKTKLIRYPIGKESLSFSIPNNVTSIEDHAFDNCTGLTSITIPNSVTSIGNFAFYDCTSLTSIIIPDSVTNIGGYAFYNCTSLTNITIPNKVTSIGYNAFGLWTSSQTINCRVSYKPGGWDYWWNDSSNANIVWGYTGE